MTPRLERYDQGYRDGWHDIHVRALSPPRPPPPTAQSQPSHYCPMEDVMSNEPALLTVPEAAARLGISVSKAWRLSREGRLPTLRIDASVRIPADALAEWIRRNTEGSR